MLQPHTMARDVARDEAEDLAAVITGYLALRKSLIMEAAKLERTLRQHIDNPAMHAERRRTIARLRDTANACSFAAGGCEVSARAVAAFRAGGAF